MAKLYWRIKRFDKWTWTAATPDNTRWENDSFPEYYSPVQKHIDSLAEDIVEKPEVYSDDE